VSVETLVSAIRSRHDGEVVADASDIEILDPDLLAASKADRANLRLLFHGVESGVLCPWRGMEPALRSFLARITEAAHDGYVGDGDPSAAMAAVRDLLLRASHLVDSRPMPPAYSYVPVLVRTVAAGWLGAEAAEASLDLADAPSFGT
jgi:hypothetical protein